MAKGKFDLLESLLVTGAYGLSSFIKARWSWEANKDSMVMGRIEASEIVKCQIDGCGDRWQTDPL